MDAAPLLEIHGVRQAFPKPDGSQLLVLEGVELGLAEGQIVGLLGRSGSGKSTLLRLIAGSHARARGPSAISASRSSALRPASPWCSRASRSFPG